MLTGFPGAYFQIKAFSETDMSEDLKKIDVPTLILHGDVDQIVPIGNAYRSGRVGQPGDIASVALGEVFRVRSNLRRETSTAIVGADEIARVWIASGTFMMGTNDERSFPNEPPAHLVEVEGGNCRLLHELVKPKSGGSI
jgi:hypothetical protein